MKGVYDYGLYFVESTQIRGSSGRSPLKWTAYLVCKYR